MNKNVRLFVGIPGSPSAAGRGYVPFTQLVNRIRPLQSMTSFGGIMIWDISQAYGNTEDVLPNYAHGVAELIRGYLHQMHFFICTKSIYLKNLFFLTVIAVVEQPHWS